MFRISYGSSIASNCAETAKTHVPIYYSALKRAHKERKLPVLREEDIEESFVRGVLIARYRISCLRKCQEVVQCVAMTAVCN